MSRKLQFLTGLSVLSLVLAVSLSVLALSPANAAPGDFNLNGRDLLMDADGDTIIDANSDDLIQFTIGGTPLPDNISGSTILSKNVHLTANTTRTGTTTLTNTALQITAQADKLYIIELGLIWDNVGTATNGKIGFSVPSSATFDGLGCGDHFGASSNFCSDLSEAASQEVGLQSNPTMYTVTGILDTAGTSGTFAVQIAQQSSTAAVQTLYADSYMTWTIYDD